MKETLRKEERVGREAKRKYDATLFDLENLQQDYQILEEERDALKLSNTTLDGENKDLESKMENMGIQKSTVDKQVEENKVRITKVEAHNSSLEVLLKATNEQNIDIVPLREHALLLRGKIYQVQVKLAEEVFKIKQVEARLQEISVVVTEFKARTQEIAETIQGQLTWLEENKAYRATYEVFLVIDTS